MPDVTIKYVKKRSILTIKNHSQDHIGWYECVARGVDGKEVVERIEVKQQQIPFSEPILTNKKCNGTYEEEFCMHGTCYMDYNNEFFCEKLFTEKELMDGRSNREGLKSAINDSKPLKSRSNYTKEKH
ncbi:hypothetical protein HUJ04_002586 [Dendroctonus ponderosae]|nr:hypothetical protein HUJ04_002586 [Dendroctonus ponderosae]KAH1024486.1 hypothetical protein HUJ05_003961 [Dendroctonus ponderosae]